MKKTENSTDKPTHRQLTFFLDDRGGITENEPSFWGGDWVSRFAANFKSPVESLADPAATEIARAVNQAVNVLPDIERRLIIDYYILCFPRKAIATRLDLSEREVDAARARAERRLRGMLAEFVEETFGLIVTGDRGCPLCRSARRAEIDDELARHYPRESWAALRQRINLRFGLDVKRVQTIMTHHRCHTVVKLVPSRQTSKKEENLV